MIIIDQIVDHQWGHVLLADGRLAHSPNGPDLLTGTVFVDAISGVLDAETLAIVQGEMDDVALDRDAPRPVCDRIFTTMVTC